MYEKQRKNIYLTDKLPTDKLQPINFKLKISKSQIST